MPLRLGVNFIVAIPQYEVNSLYAEVSGGSPVISALFSGLLRPAPKGAGLALLAMQRICHCERSVAVP